MNISQILVLISFILLISPFISTVIFRIFDFNIYETFGLVAYYFPFLGFTGIIATLAFEYLFKKFKK